MPIGQNQRRLEEAHSTMTILQCEDSCSHATAVTPDAPTPVSRLNKR